MKKLLFMLFIGVLILPSCSDNLAIESQQNYFKMNSNLLNLDLTRVDDEFFKGIVEFPDSYTYDGFITFNHSEDNGIIDVRNEGDALFIRFSDSEIGQVKLQDFSMPEENVFSFVAKNYNNETIATFDYKEDELQASNVNAFKIELASMLDHSEHRAAWFCLGGAVAAAAIYGAYNHCNSNVSAGVNHCETMGFCADIGFCSASCVACPQE